MAPDERQGAEEPDAPPAAAGVSQPRFGGYCRALTYELTAAVEISEPLTRT